MRVALLAAALAVMAAVGVVQAQTPAPEPIEITHGGFTYELPGEQPLVAYVRERSENFDGEWVVYTPFAREANGHFTALTPCDDIAVLCQPIRTRATEALSGAHVGDILILTGAADE